MSRYKELKTHLFRLVHIARSGIMKRTLTAIDPKPSLNFWCLIYGNQLDITILEWCKIFGSNGEATHWKKIVPPTDHNQFRAELIKMLGITEQEWEAYWNELKNYRDNQVAHHIEIYKVSNYPSLSLALKSSFFYYKYLIKEWRLLGETTYPNDLESYCIAFEEQVREVASQAVKSTMAIKEKVY